MCNNNLNPFPGLNFQLFIVQEDRARIFMEKRTGTLVMKIYNVSSVIPLGLTDVIFFGRAQYKQNTIMLLNNKNCVFSFTSVQLIWMIRHRGTKGNVLSTVGTKKLNRMVYSKSCACAFNVFLCFIFHCLKLCSHWHCCVCLRVKYIAKVCV